MQLTRCLLWLDRRPASNCLLYDTDVITVKNRLLTMVDRFPMFSCMSLQNLSGKSRSILCLALVASILSSGTLFYHYQRGNIKPLRGPFHFRGSFSFAPTAPWPPPAPPIPTTIPVDEDVHRYPPLYPDVTAAEYLLSQHNDTLPFPEGSSAQFVRFANEQPGVGFNNQLKEMCVPPPPTHPLAFACTF